MSKKRRLPELSDGTKEMCVEARRCKLDGGGSLAVICGGALPPSLPDRPRLSLADYHHHNQCERCMRACAHANAQPQNGLVSQQLEERTQPPQPHNTTSTTTSKNTPLIFPLSHCRKHPKLKVTASICCSAPMPLLLPLLPTASLNGFSQQTAPGRLGGRGGVSRQLKWNGKLGAHRFFRSRWPFQR
jgi:hypothetical protein